MKSLSRISPEYIQNSLSRVKSRAGRVRMRYQYCNIRKYNLNKNKHKRPIKPFVMPGYARLGQLSTGVLAGTGEPANRRAHVDSPRFIE